MMTLEGQIRQRTLQIWHPRTQVAQMQKPPICITRCVRRLDKEWPSLPQGGAFHCQVAATSPLYTLILFALVLGLRRRR